MDTLAKDTEQLINFSKPNTGGQTILEALGYNVDSTFADAMETAFTTDTTIISLGGQDNIGQARDLKIQLNQEDSIIAGLQMGIAGKCILDADSARISNIVSLFKGSSMSFGNKQICVSEGAVYSQFNLALRSKPEIMPYQDQIWLDTDDHNEAFIVAGDYDSVLEATNKKSARAIKRDFWFFVPLWMIFPTLKTIEDGVLYTGRGQQVTFNIVTSNYSDCVYDRLSTTQRSYTLSKMGLFQRYTRVHPLIDKILQKEFIFHPLIYDSQRVPVARETNNFNLSISAGERMKRLVFGFCPNLPAADAAMGGVLSTYGANRYNQMLTYFPKFRVESIHLDIGGQKICFDAEQCALIQLIQPTQTVNSLVGYDGGLYSGFRRDIKCVYALDLSRFAIDMVGSTNKSHTSVLGTIKVKVGDTDSTLISVSLAAGGDAAALNIVTGDHLAKFNLYVFLEKTMPVHLVRGQYK